VKNFSNKEFYEKLLESNEKSGAERLKDMHDMFRVQASILGMQYILFTKNDIESKNIKVGTRFFKKLDKQWKKYEEKVFIVIDGYDNEVNTELYEIPEVREFIRELLKKNPQMLFYLSRDTESLQMVMGCMGDFTVIKPIETETIIDKIKANSHRLDELDATEITNDVGMKLTFDSALLQEIVLGYADFFSQFGDEGIKGVERLTGRISSFFTNE